MKRIITVLAIVFVITTILSIAEEDFTTPSPEDPTVIGGRLTNILYKIISVLATVKITYLGYKYSTAESVSERKLIAGEIQGLFGGIIIVVCGPWLIKEILFSEV